MTACLCWAPCQGLTGLGDSGGLGLNHLSILMHSISVATNCNSYHSQLADSDRSTNI